MRVRPALIATAALAAVIATTQITALDAATPFQPDAYERDDTARYARALPATTTHSFHSATDADWFRLVVTTPDQPLVIETTPLSGELLNTRITVFHRAANGALTEVDANDDHPTFPDTLASGLMYRAKVPGTYLVRVDQSAAGEMGQYRLHYSLGSTRRIAGADTYATAAELSRTIWSNTGLSGWGSSIGPSRVVVASADDTMGALAGSVLAASNDSVLLLTQKTRLPAATGTELRRLLASRHAAGKKSTVYVVGSTATVSSSVDTALKAIAGVGTVVRLSGSDAASTASRISAELRATAGLRNRAYVVRADDWHAAMVAAPLAASTGAPLLYSDGDRLGVSATGALRSLRPDQVVVLASTTQTPTALLTEVETVTSRVPTLVSGQGAAALAANAAVWGEDTLGLDPRSCVFVSQDTASEGLGAATLAWWTSGPIMFTGRSVVPSETTSFLDMHAPRLFTSHALGGTGSIGNDAFSQLQE